MSTNKPTKLYFSVHDIIIRFYSSVYLIETVTSLDCIVYILFSLVDVNHFYILSELTE